MFFFFGSQSKVKNYIARSDLDIFLSLTWYGVTGAGLYVLITNFVYQVSSRHVHKFLSVLRLSQN